MDFDFLSTDSRFVPIFDNKSAVASKSLIISAKGSSFVPPLPPVGFFFVVGSGVAASIPA